MVPRTAPASPATGSAYPYNLPVRCGIDYAFFAGRWWQADKPTARVRLIPGKLCRIIAR